MAGQVLNGNFSDDALVVTLTVKQLRGVVADTVRRTIAQDPAVFAGDDELITPDEAAKMLNVTKNWLYKNHKRLAFGRKLSRKKLVFSKRGILLYMRGQYGGKHIQA